MELVNYFGAPLVKLQVDQKIVDQLNDYSDQILGKENFPKTLNATKRLASSVNNEFYVKPGFLEDVETFLKECGTAFHQKFTQSEKMKSVKLEIDAMWVVSQRQGEWNDLHFHSGDISGVLYLKMPTAPAHGLSPEDKRNKSPGAITFADGTGGAYRKNIFTVQPKVGELYLFPSSLFHTVNPFFGPEERRSFSFNLIVKPLPV